MIAADAARRSAPSGLLPATLRWIATISWLARNREAAAAKTPIKNLGRPEPPRVLLVRLEAVTSKEIRNMTARPNKLWIAGLAIAGSLGLSATSASAQAVYVDPYVQPYPVVVAPGGAYVAPAPIVVPPIVRERTVVVGRPAYVPAPAYGVPVPRYDYGGYGYAGYGYDYADW
jgi:hypothetical protein